MGEDIPLYSEDPGSSSSIASRLRSHRQLYEPEDRELKDDTVPNHQVESQDTSADASDRGMNTLGRVTRQRTGISLRPEDQLPRRDNSHSPYPTASTEAISQICLCQPDPKIPRPRNAFILYRQHRQQSILSQHRGLSNPEISKIAGQLWQAESEGVKNTWKAFAEEEKARHAQQYPDYRFQPRHKNKSSPTLVPGDKDRCQKCGGRSVAATSSPFPTPLPATQSQDRAVEPPDLPTPPQTSLFNSGRRLQGAMFAANAPADHRDGYYSVAASPMARRFPDTVVGQPDPKRRRHEPYGATASATRPEVIHGAASHGQTTRSAPVSHSSPHTGDRKRASLSGLPETLYSSQRDSATYSNSSSPPITPHTAVPVMGPPPTRAPSISGRNGLHAYPATPTTSYHHSLLYASAPQGRKVSEPLRLMPLLSPAAGEHSRSIGAMIMSIPVLGKLAQLRRIAPPIKEPLAGLPPHRVRGSIIAIEGDDHSLAEAMSAQLETILRRNDEFDIRVLSGPRPPGQHCVLKDYIDAVSEWHDESKKMVDFATGLDYQRSDQRQRNGSITDCKPMPTGWGTKDADGSMQVDAEEGEILEDATKIAHETSHDAGRLSAGQQQMSRIPLLLVSNYLLRGSNAWSSALPINDVYSPADHWAWTATLWRGVAGADLTVYVRNVDKDRDEPVSAGGVGLPANEKRVEIKDEVGAILVKRENGKVEESAVRRVAFEIGEWVRTQAGKQS